MYTQKINCKCGDTVYEETFSIKASTIPTFLFDETLHGVNLHQNNVKCWSGHVTPWCDVKVHWSGAELVYCGVNLHNHGVKWDINWVFDTRERCTSTLFKCNLALKKCKLVFYTNLV